MNEKLSRLTPPGVSAMPQIKAFIGLNAVCALCSLHFFSDFWNALAELYTYSGEVRNLIPGRSISYYIALIQGDLRVFLLPAALMLLYTVFYYFSYFRHSKSVYTMRRIGKPMELHRRCWSLPVLLSLGSVLIGLLLFWLYFGIYMLAAPKEALPPDQWQMIWRVLL